MTESQAPDPGWLKARKAKVDQRLPGRPKLIGAPENGVAKWSDYCWSDEELEWIKDHLPAKSEPAA